MDQIRFFVRKYRMNKEPRKLPIFIPKRKWSENIFDHFQVKHAFFGRFFRILEWIIKLS